MQKRARANGRSEHTAVADMLSEPRESSVGHFGHQEQRFEAHGDPARKTPAGGHERLAAKVGDGASVPRSHLSEMFSSWIHHHIPEVVRRCLEFLRERGMR